MKKSFNKIALFMAMVLIFTAFPLAASAADSSGAVVTSQGKKVDLFDFKQEDIAGLYKAKSGEFMVVPIIENEDFIKTINTLDKNSGVKKITVDADEAANSIEASFMIVFKNGARSIYTLNKNNRLMAGGDYYTIPAETYKTLLGIFNKTYNHYNYPQWLIYMNPRLISSISGTTVDNNGVAHTATVSKKADMNDVIQGVRNLKVTSGGYYMPKINSIPQGPGNYTFKVNFNNKGEKSTYTIMVAGTAMYIESDELHIGTKYRVNADDVKTLVNALNAVAEK